MKTFKLLLSVIAAAAFSSCGTATVEGEFAAAPSSAEVLVKLSEGSSMRVIDTVALKGNAFRYSMPIEKGCPEFVYLYCGDTKVASLLLERGDRVRVLCDTLGSWQVEGSRDCELLREREMEFASLIARNYIPVKEYVSYYRKMTKFILENSHSLVCVPVCFQQFGDGPVFAQLTDGMLFCSIADSLSTKYPDSKYVKMLRSEGESRRNVLKMQGMISEAPTAGYPEVRLPGIDGKEISLSESAGEASLLVYWDATDPVNKMYNLEVLKPLWDEFHSKGLGIYAVNVGVDKSTWAMVVSEQKLPWNNVCDTRGSSVVLYGVSKTPSVFVVTGDGAQKMEDVNLPALRKVLKSKL